MKRKTLIIIALIVLIEVSGFFYLYDQTFGQFWTTERIINKPLDNKARIFRIDIDPEAQYPHGIDLTIKGELNGKAIIGYGWNDTSMYMIGTMENDFDRNFRTDWYSDSCFVFYQPINVTDGEIKIDCKIYSSKK